MPPSAIRAYLKEVAAIQRGGEFTEHSFRAPLQKLLQALLPGVDITNEPGRVMPGGAPDYVLKRAAIPLGYIEAKNIDKSLDDKLFSEQFNRYLQSLDNLIFTNYLQFRFHRDGETKAVAEVDIAELRGGKIKLLPDNFARFADLVTDFGAYQGQTITTADDLAARMADKARLLAGVIESALSEDEKNGNGRNSELQSQLSAFREILDAGIKPQRFAGIYAQTIAYGMFVARLHDPSPATFTRVEAAGLIPGSNPFLKKFFGYIAALDLDARIRWLVDDLADIFRAADVGALMKNFGRATQQSDPFIHFYETFLGAYDSKLRKGRGVYYTPAPAVNFIVRAVDEILKTEFKLKDGLADTAKTTVTTNGAPREVHKVQILDPGTGTGTFLAEVVNGIYAKFAGQKGVWPDYVKNDLLPRLNGFEILMAPYAMAHVKLEMILRETGFELGSQRLRIYLTNSLENREAETKMHDIPFANWLVNEARGADEVKRDAPVMVVMGNPPYAVSSSNRGRWIQALIEDYKEDLNEKKLNLDDDYIKFIRFGQFLIDKTGEGILAYISNNSFVDGLTHRRMRERLLETFDRIYVINLHGDSRKQERSPDGSPDQNVFDIMQGVSINIFVKSNKKKAGAPAEVFHRDLFGAREAKYEFLWRNTLGKVKFNKLKPRAPYFFFVPKDFSVRGEYDKGFGVKELFPVFNSGVKTDRDSLFINRDKAALTANINKLLSGDMDLEFVSTHKVKDSSGYKLTQVIRGKEFNPDHVTDIVYRPFDWRWIYYDKAIISRPAEQAMRHMAGGDNLGLVTTRQHTKRAFRYILVSKTRVDGGVTGAWSYFFPLYVYPDETQKTIGGETARKPNLNADIVQQVADQIGLRFVPEQTDDGDTFAPVDILDYIYAALHSPKDDYEITDSAAGLGKVWLNDTQYFGEVPQIAWDFYIGGYQPAKKYLKDRKGRTLTWDEIHHYQKIIVALVETAKAMDKIDAVA